MAMSKRQRNLTLVLIVTVAVIVFIISSIAIPKQADDEVRKQVLAADSSAVISKGTMHFSTSHLFVYQYEIAGSSKGYKRAIWHAIPHNEVVLEK